MSQKKRSVEHVVGPLLDSGVQECSRCGEIVTDYRNTMVPAGTPPLTGLSVGSKYVKIENGPGQSLGNGTALRLGGASRELTDELAVACNPILEHVAAEPEAGMRQNCSRCSTELVQFTQRGGPGTQPPPGAFAPPGEAVVATATVLMPQAKWGGPTRPCTAK